jgi:hypothetical protein
MSGDCPHLQEELSSESIIGSYTALVNPPACFYYRIHIEK